MKKEASFLSVIAAVSAIVSALVGLFYRFGGEIRTVTNLYGQEIELYGDGIYANNSLLKVGATKGTDIVMLMVAVLLLVLIIFLKEKAYSNLLQAGLLSCLLYSSTCLIMGVSFNRLFPLYLIQFSSALFSFIIKLSSLHKNEIFIAEVYQKKLKGTSVFLIIGGCSVLIWLSFIIPAVINGTPKEFIEVYTTEPTFAIDLGIIFPICLYSGVALLKQKKIAYLLASVLMTLVTSVGFCVIAQTMMQMRLGIDLNAGQLFGMVVSFVILGAFAIFLNFRLLRYVKSC